MATTHRGLLPLIMITLTIKIKVIVQHR